MLSFAGNIRLFLAPQAVDCRKSFNGLAALVEADFQVPVMGGDVFVFLNRRANQVRLLFWDRDGFCIIAKRLEAGTFHRVRQADQVPDTLKLILQICLCCWRELRQKSYAGTSVIV